MTHFTDDEIAILVLLVATLDPEKFAKPAAKSVIYKCKAMKEAVS